MLGERKRRRKEGEGKRGVGKAERGMEKAKGSKI